MTTLLFLLGIGLAALLLIGASLAFVLMVVQTIQRKGRMGVNLRSTECPRCGTPFPAVRRPANLRQALWGGWTCAGCGQESDKWGQPTEG